MEQDLYRITLASIPCIIVIFENVQIIAGGAFIIFFLSLSAFLSFAEGAYLSLSSDDIEKLKEDKNKKTKTAVKLHSNIKQLIVGILIIKYITNTFCILTTAYLCFNLFDFDQLPVLKYILCAIITASVLIFAVEIIPKACIGKNTAKTAKNTAPLINAIVTVLKPFLSAFTSSSNLFYAQKSSVITDELTNAIELLSNDDEDDKELLKGIVNFGNTVVSEIMCPRIDVTAIDIETGFDKIIPMIIESGFSRIPVYSETFDSVKGILYVKDIFPHAKSPADFEWQSLLRPPYFVPETKKIHDLLKEFQTKKIHMAIIIDEYGGASGIVTMEDILEEIVGEITDESDIDETLYTKLDESTYIFKGKVLLDDFCKALNINENYFDNVRGESETIAGLLLEITGEIPQRGNVIEYNCFKFSVESADKRRVKNIKVKLKPDAESI